MNLKIENLKRNKILRCIKSENQNNRFLCPNCNFITSRKGISRLAIICPICGRILTRITISSDSNY